MKQKKLPLLFIGHGNPMNAIYHNAFTNCLGDLGKSLSKPRAILCVSAHWMTEGTWITSMQNPKTIHDFYGFPDQLFQIQYPAPGAPEIADEIISLMGNDQIHPDKEAWGLDHGTWSILCHMFPEADIPVMQLSLYLAKNTEYHFELGKKLAQLREKGILIIGSGNIVHNLRQISFSQKAEAYPWAIQFDQWVKEKLMAKDYPALLYDYQKSMEGKLSVPTLEHWLPLYYILGAVSEDDELEFVYEGVENASISMRSFQFKSKV